MKTTTLEFLKLLPEFMRSDPTVQGLAEAVEAVLAGPAAEVPNARVWDRIDHMDAAQLDALAWELDIDWYNTGWDIEAKRATIKSSDKIYRKRGTKWAVEQVIADVFGGGFVTEWNEYGGEPYHFKATTSYLLQDTETVERFRALVAKAKRASARLDTIEFAQDGTAAAYAMTKAVGMTVTYAAFAAKIG